ncbi:MAG: hypothetical protein IJA87_00845 [Clostridia bacterium]|nr:hypothetical protein [Clostridia bacterium]
MSRKRKKGNLKKNNSQLKEYNNFIMNSSFSPNSTIPITNNMLLGTAEFEDDNGELESSKEIKKTPLKYKAIDWLKQNIFPTIITTIVVAIGSTVLAHQISIAVVNEKIDNIKNKIEELEENSVNKEIFSLQLEDIEKNINSSYSITLNDIKWQIKILEEKIEKLDS